MLPGSRCVPASFSFFVSSTLLCCITLQESASSISFFQGSASSIFFHIAASVRLAFLGAGLYAVMDRGGSKCMAQFHRLFMLGLLSAKGNTRQALTKEANACPKSSAVT